MTSEVVDLLVKKKMLRRNRSKNDRRSVLIRLTSDTSGLFEISERSLQETIAGLDRSLGRDTLRALQNNLVTVATALQEVVGGWPPNDSEASEAGATGDADLSDPDLRGPAG